VKAVFIVLSVEALLDIEVTSGKFLELVGGTIILAQITLLKNKILLYN
jgi:hypothetical protein